MMTIKQAKEEVKKMGFMLHKNQFGEYVLRHNDCEYFGGSVEDAVETARAITGYDPTAIA